MKKISLPIVTVSAIYKSIKIDGIQKKLLTVFSKEFFIIRLIGIEPTHLAPEASALSTELQMHNGYLRYSTTKYKIVQAEIFLKNILEKSKIFQYNESIF